LKFDQNFSLGTRPNETFGIKPSTGELLVKRAWSIEYDARSKCALAIIIANVAGLTASLNLVFLVNIVGRGCSTQPATLVQE
jgi:hypothetical protein